MNRVIFVVLAISIGLASGMIGSRSAQENACMPGELVVFFVDDGQSALSITPSAASARNPSVDRVLARHGLASAKALFGPRSRLRNAYLLRFPQEARTDAIISALERLPQVRSVSKNWILKPDFTPDDYYFNHDSNSDGRLDQWVFQRTQQDRAWDVTVGDTSVVVALIDTGFDLDHPDLDGVVWVNSGETPGNDTDDDENGYVDDVNGYDFFDDDSDPGPDSGDEGNHGTVVGSIIAAETNTGSAYGVAGASWASRIMSLRVGSEDIFDFSAVIEAINYAIDNGADVINMSFSTTLAIQQLEDAVEAADGAGLIMVGSAGDDDVEAARYPGSYPEVIRVAAVDSATAKTDDSNYGTDVYLVAPSSNNGDGDIFTCDYDTSAAGTNPGDDKPHVFSEFEVATSGAAAQVTGAVALLKARYPSASKAIILAELERGATPVSDALYSQGKLGAGMANAYRSVTQWGTIARDTTWAGLAFVSGDLTIASAETLHVAPGTTVYVATDDNEEAGTYTSRVEFVVNGYLDCRGTAGNPIVFKGFNTSDRDAWLGFNVASSSLGARFEHVVIENAETAIDHWEPVVATNVVIRDCEIGIESRDDLTLSYSNIASVTDYGVYFHKGTATLTTDTLSSSDQTGIGAAQYATGDSIDINLTNCHIHHNDVYGVQCGNGVRTLDMTGSKVSYNYVGVSSVAAETEISGATTIEHNGNGVFASGPANVSATVQDNTTVGVALLSTQTSYCVSSTVEDNGIGVLLTGSGVNPVVVFSTIQGNTTGILCNDEANCNVYGNVIHGNTTGVKCDNGATGVFAYNSIKSSGMGVLAANGANPNLGDVSSGLGGGNHFDRNTWDVSNATQGTTIKAEENCWNPSTGPKITGLGSVDTDPEETECEEAFVYRKDGEEPLPEPALPTRYALTGAHPNPFNPTVTIRYDVPAPGGKVSVQVYDVGGHLVTTLVDESRPAGRHAVTWSGSGFASGVYFVKMTASQFTQTRKIVLLK